MNFEYKNIDEIISDRFPKRGITIPLGDIELLQKQLVVPDFEIDHVNTITNQRDFKVELHVFMQNLSYVKSEYDIRTHTVELRDNRPIIHLQVHKDIQSVGIPPNQYRLVYNFMRNIVGGESSPDNVFVSDISDDRTELKLSLVNPDSISAKKSMARFVLENIKPKTFIPPIVLNFGENKILDVINVTSDGDTTSCYIKLYEPLPADIDRYFVCWIDVKLMKPYIDTVTLIPDIVASEQSYISGPNFEVDYDYWITSETNYKSWSDILSENVQTSEQILNKYISSSGEEVNLNVDFSEFKNFIYYSSATDRVENFVYKVQMVERYRSELDRINTITGSTDTNRIKLQLLKDKLVSGFDSFEKYLYYNSTGSFNYTYQLSSSVYPYPKYLLDVSSSEYHVVSKEGKFNFYTSGSTEVETWYLDIIEKSMDYDSKNYYALARALPDHIKEDSDNEQAVTFVNMLAQHFDVMYLYTDHLLKRNLREEHPKDGVSQDMIYDVTKNMGWTLSHGTSAKDLWEYALGISGSTEPIWTGKTTVDRYHTKTYEERTKEVWRRILNNLPYLYKTKGTSRSVKALLSAYGIPQTLLTIREFGGPDNSDIDLIPKAEWEKHTYYLNFNGSYPLPTNNHYVSVPWDKVNGSAGYQYPDTVTLRWKMQPSDLYSYQSNTIQTLMQKNSGSRVDWYVTVHKDGTEDDKGSVIFHIGDGSTYVSASITDEYLYDDIPLNLMIRRSLTSDASSSNQQYDMLLKTSKYGKLAVERSASVIVSGSSTPNIQRAWVSNGTLFIGSGSNAQTDYILSGSVFELRYWTNQLNESSFNNHTLAARAYNGNTPTSSFYDLQAQFKFWQPFDLAATSSLISSHPNQANSTFQSTPKTASFYGMVSSSFESIVETYNMEVATVGSTTPYAAKVRIDSGSLIGGLSSTESSEVSAFDTFSVDSDKLMIAFSPQSIINEDIYEAIGNVAIDDYFGDYSNINSSDYPRLKWFANEYWKKYPNKNDFTAYIKLIAIFDFSIFDQIRQVLPARVNGILGLVIEPNILERSKTKFMHGVSAESPSNTILTTTELSASVSSNASISSHTTIIRIGFDNESEYQEIDGDMYTDMYMDGSRDINVSTDIDVEVVPIAIRKQYKTVVTASRNQRQSLPTVFKPYAATLLVKSGSIFSSNEYVSLNGSVNSRISSTLQSMNNTVFDYGELDSAFTVTYERDNIRKSTDTSLNVGYGDGWVTSSNDNGKATSLFSTIRNHITDGYYSEYKFIYSSSQALSERQYLGYSLQTSSIVSPYRLSIGIQNHRFLGSKISSPDINVDTRETPDGKSVVEVYFTSPDQIRVDGDMDSNVGGNISIV